MTRPGTRVWVVQNETPTAVYSYGFGTYLGDQLMPGWDHPNMLALCEKSVRKFDAEGPIFDQHAYADRLVAAGTVTREEADQRIAAIAVKDAAERARPIEDRACDSARRLGMNPRIALDRGGHVWGAECWWGEADDDAPARFAKGRLIWVGPCRENLASRVKVTGSYFQGVVPDGAVYVGRPAPGLPGSPWANPFRPRRPIPRTVRLAGKVRTVDPTVSGWIEDAEHAVQLYRETIRAAELEYQVRAAFGGKALACWCKPDQPCHVDMLVAFTNAWVPA